MYTKKLIKLLIWGAVGFLLGMGFCGAMELGSEFGELIMCGWLLSSIPYGWNLSTRVVPTVIAFSLPIMFLLFAARVLIAAITGWIVMPISIINCIIHIVREKREIEGV